MSTFELIIFLVFFISHAIFLSIVLYNYSTAPRIYNSNVKLNNKPLISILIPARNEEHNIGNLIQSINNQSYENYEVFVLDDSSSDATSQIVMKFSSLNDKINLIKGEDVPKDWLGKNWACYQLSKHAKGDILLFIDADVIVNQNALLYAIRELENISMLSVFPTQNIKSFGEWIVVPLMNWLLLNFLPLKFVYNTVSNKFVAANGQFIMIKKEVYFNIGTHEIVRDKVVEDMEFARIIKSNGYKVKTALGENSIYCNMYKSLDESIKGFIKNFYSGFNISKPVFILMIITLSFLFTAPIIFFLINKIFLVILVMIIFERVFISLMSRQNWVNNLILHPLQMVIMLFVGFKSVLNKSNIWKGRII